MDTVSQYSSYLSVTQYVVRYIIYGRYDHKTEFPYRYILSPTNKPDTLSFYSPPCPVLFYPPPAATLSILNSPHLQKYHANNFLSLVIMIALIPYSPNIT
jgi:hypothetical protein